MADQPTIPEIVEQAKRLGTISVPVPYGTAYIKPHSPGWWIVTFVTKKTIRIARTDEELKALLLRWGYKED